MMRALGWWISRLAPRRHRDLFLRELDELYGARVERMGRFGADAWYLGQCVGFVVRSAGDGLTLALDEVMALGRDTALSARALLRRPGYLASAILTLGIGTGSVAIVYGAANWVLLRDVPGVGAAEELTWVRLESKDDTWGGITWGISDVDVGRLREGMGSLAAFEATAEYPVHVRMPESEAADRLTAALVTPGYFDALEMNPVVGRFFEASDHVGLAGPAEVVVGFDLWQRYWQGTARAVGAGIEVNGRPFTVIGVAPKGFRGSELPGSSELWLASSAAELVRGLEGESALGGQFWDRLVGRRKPGATSAQVAAEANAVVQYVREEVGGLHSFAADHFIFRAYDGIGLDPWVRADVERTLLILMGGSAFLLLLAIANVANLSLTRAASRRRLVAIRRALGAGSWRVAREPLVEGGIAGLAGAAIGVGLVFAGGWAFSEARLTAQGASIEGMAIDGKVVLVTVVVAVVAGMLAGLAPALDTRREKVLESLTGGRTEAPRATRLRSTLVVAQVALSATLLIGAGLFVRTVLNLNRIELGVRSDAYTFSVAPGLNGYDERRSLERLAEVERRVADVAGTQSVGIVFPALMNGWRISSSLRPASGSDDERVFGSAYWTTGAGFARALGVQLVAGSGFEQDLLASGEDYRPVMINEVMASKLFPGLSAEDVVGREVQTNQSQQAHTVTGVLSNARLSNPRFEAGPTAYLPYDVEWAEGVATFYVAGAVPEGEMTRRVREAVAGVDPRLPIYDVGTMDDLIGGMLADQRIVARLAAALGATGLLLAAIGLYGVLSYAVHERTREIGVRVALGASTQNIRSSVIRRGVALTGVGILIGLPLARATSTLIESRLFEVGAMDAASYGIGLAVLLAVALVASWIPARRAMRVSPVEALKDTR